MTARAWLVSIVGCALAVAACDRGSEYGANETSLSQDRIDGAAGTAGGEMRVADIVAAPDEYFGRTVTVTADVEEVFGPMAFALDEDAPFTGGIDNDLLVLSRQAGDLEAIDDQWLNNKVRVTGTVGRMTVTEVERELGWDLDPELEIELERAGAVLIASSVNRVDDQGAVIDRGAPANARATDRQARADLPATASWLPLAGIVGLLSFGGAVGLRLLRRG
jgi:hypothetical protein